MNSRFFLVFIAVAVVTQYAAAQISLRTDIPVSGLWGLMDNPWAGGFTAPQICPMDLNNDGTQDLVAFDRQTHSVIPFLQVGWPGSNGFRYAPRYIINFPEELFEWIFTYDYDGDGYYDLFTGSTDSRIIAFRNTSSSTPGVLSFEKVKDPLFSLYNTGTYIKLFSSKIDYPAMIDVDEDGDMDILTFESSGARVEWHKNISIDSGWGLDTLDFVLQSACFGHFEEDGTTCLATVDMVPCGAGMKTLPDTEDGGVHLGSSVLALDVNGDSLKELVIGDISCSNLYLLHNAGTLDIAHFDSVENNFPTSSSPVKIKEFPAGFYVDVNNDGKRDLIAAPNQTGGVEDRRATWYYENMGTDEVPDLQFRQFGFLQGSMIETGSGSLPAFFDYDNDGLKDMVVGNLNYYMVGAASETVLQLYLNKGTASMPAFELYDDDWMSFSDSSLINLATAFADLDADGDPDMVIGNFTGNLHYFENTAAPGDTAEFTFVTSTFESINVSLYSAPNFVDIDKDNDFDLLVGNNQGYVGYYENIGTPSAFDFQLVTSSFGGIKLVDETGVSISSGFSRPAYFDYDNDGVDELLVGGVTGMIEIYEDVTLIPGDTFTYAGNLLDHDFGGYASPVAARLDSSTNYTVVVGGYRGGLQLVGIPGIVSRDQLDLAPVTRLHLWPNPARNMLHLSIEGVNANELQIGIYNIVGSQLIERSMRGNAASLSIQDLPNGIYFAEVKTAEQRLIKKFVVQR